MTPSLVKEKKITVNGKEYTISFPKVRDQFDIESRKHLMSNGTYGTQERANTEDSNFNLNLIDAIAHISVLCPKLMKDLVGGDNSTPDPYEMELHQTKYIVQAWSQFSPWYLDIKKEVNSAMLEDQPNKDTAKM